MLLFVVVVYCCPSFRKWIVLPSFLISTVPFGRKLAACCCGWNVRLNKRTGNKQRRRPFNDLCTYWFDYYCIVCFILIYYYCYYYSYCYYCICFYILNLYFHFFLIFNFNFILFIINCIYILFYFFSRYPTLTFSFICLNLFSLLAQLVF